MQVGHKMSHTFVILLSANIFKQFESVNKKFNYKTKILKKNNQ